MLAAAVSSWARDDLQAFSYPAWDGVNGKLYLRTLALGSEEETASEARHAARAAEFDGDSLRRRAIEAVAAAPPERLQAILAAAAR